MKIYTKILIISIGLLLASLEVSAHSNPNKTIPSVAKLPMASVSPLTSHLPMYDWEMVSDEISPAPDDAKPVLLNVPAVGGQFEFDALDTSLDEYMAAFHAEQSMMAPPDGSPFVDAMQAAVDQKDNIQKAKNIIDEALVVGREIQSLIAGELVSLPVYMTETIGNKDVTLVIQSANIFPQYAQLEVYMKIDLGKTDFYGNDAILYFGADKILFNSEQGIIYGSIGLLSDQSIKLDNSSKAGLVFRKMKKELKTGEGTTYDPDLPDSYDYFGTFANFDCDGFKELGVEGTFVMSRDWVIPTDELGIPLTVPKETDISTVTPRVHASVAVIVQDWNDFLLTINLDPMVFANWQEVGFALSNATLDMSTYRNAPDYPYTDPNEWEGVYIENISITLPTPFKRSCGSFANTSGEGEAGSSSSDSNNSSQNNPAANGDTQNNTNFDPPELCRTKVSGKYLRIDKNGVSGQISIEGQVPLVGGGVAAGEWGMSMDVIQIGLVNSKIVQFYVEGELGAPIVSKKTPLDYTVDFEFDLDRYNFDVTIPTDKPIEIPVWNAANVTLTNPTIGAVIADGDFDMWVKFQTTKVKIGKSSDYVDSENGSLLKMPSLTLTDMRLSTSAPYFLFSGVQVEGGDTKVANFPVTLDNLSLGTPETNPEELILGFDLIINLMESSGNSVTATGYMDMKGEYIRNVDGTRSWKYKSMHFEGAEITVCVPQFYGQGTLQLLKNDPEYGTGFTASLEAGILGFCNENNPSVDDFQFQLQMTSIFGSKDTYRYFLVDGFIGGKAIKIPLFGPIYMDGFGGGVFHNMAPSEYVEDPGESSLGVDLSGIKYKPTTSTRLGIKFATSISTPEKLLDGLLTCIIRFDENMSLQNITFWGVADLMVRTDIEEDIVNAVDNLHDRLPSIVQTVSEIQQADKDKAKAAGTGEESGIKAKLGVSLDLAGGFSFHVYGEVTLRVQGPSDNPDNPLLVGSGQLDLLLDPDKNNWHFFVGGYYPNPQGIEIVVPDFFNEDDFITLQPVGATMSYGGFTASAGFYFLAGNKIPGPPPPPAHVVEFFDGGGSDTDPDIQEFEENGNRGLLTCGGNDPALGTGLAFGAHAKIEFNAKIKGILGCFGGLRVNAIGGVGFDLAFLKYGNGTACDLSNDSPHGLNGFRATGLAYAFVDIKGHHVTCFPIPPLGVGLKIKFDVPNPSYFQIKAVIKIGMKVSVGVGIGTECGTPCSSTVTVE